MKRMFLFMVIEFWLKIFQPEFLPLTAILAVLFWVYLELRKTDTYLRLTILDLCERNVRRKTFRKLNNASSFHRSYYILDMMPFFSFLLNSSFKVWSRRGSFPVLSNIWDNLRKFLRFIAIGNWIMRVWHKQSIKTEMSDMNRAIDRLT